MKKLRFPATLYFLVLFVPLIYMWAAWIVIPAFAQSKDWESRVQILIHANTPDGQFNDAIYVSQSDYEKLTPEDIDKQVKARVDTWIAFVKEQSSKPPVVPTKEELKESATAQVEQLDRVADQLIAAAPAKADLQAVVDKLQISLDKLKTAASTAKVNP